VSADINMKINLLERKGKLKASGKKGAGGLSPGGGERETERRTSLVVAFSTGRVESDFNKSRPVLHSSGLGGWRRGS